MELPFDFINSRKSDIQDIKNSCLELQVVSSVPEKDQIPLEGEKWLRTDDLACVFIDLVKSTELQVIKHPETTAKVYQLFVDNMVRTLQNFDAEFIDVRGDGGFGIFVGEKACVLALCAAITFKTLCRECLQNAINDFKIMPHIGIDQKAVVFKRIGLRGDWQNVVWAGKPVSMSSKLASLSVGQEVTVSDRVFQIFSQPQFYKHAVRSCGCAGGVFTGNYVSLWRERDVSDKTYLDFKSAYSLSSDWCKTHGDAYCAALLKAAKK